MQDVITALGQFIPIFRILKLLFSRDFKYYLFRTVLRDFRQLYWSGYNSVIEGVNDCNLWHLIPHCSPRKYHELKPFDDIPRFLKYIGPFISSVHKIHCILACIKNGDIETMDKIFDLMRSQEYHDVRFFDCSLHTYPAFEHAVSRVSKIAGIRGMFSGYPGGTTYNIDANDGIIEDVFPSTILPGCCPNIFIPKELIFRHCHGASFLFYLKNGGKIHILQLIKSMNHEVSIPNAILEFIPKLDIADFIKCKNMSKNTRIRLNLLIMHKKNLPNFVRKYRSILQPALKTPFHFNNFSFANLSVEHLARFIRKPREIVYFRNIFKLKPEEICEKYYASNGRCGIIFANFPKCIPEKLQAKIYNNMCYGADITIPLVRRNLEQFEHRKDEVLASVDQLIQYSFTDDPLAVYYVILEMYELVFYNIGKVSFMDDILKRIDKRIRTSNREFQIRWFYRWMHLF